MKIRIYADFNNRNEDGFVRLTVVGSERDLTKYETSLTEGINVILYDEELEIDATLKRDPRLNIWLGVPDWTTRRDLDSNSTSE